MLTAIQPDWQAPLAADPADQAWIDADEQAYFNTLARAGRSPPLPLWPPGTGYGLVLGNADLGDAVMIYLHPRMTLVTANYFLRLSGYRLRWNMKNRTAEIVPI